MIKIYCEDGALNRHVKKLKRQADIEIYSFPFENTNSKTKTSSHPSELRVSNRYLRINDPATTRINQTLRSDIFEEIEKIVGSKNYNDIRHIDTAFKEECQIFVTPDKKDISSKSEELEKLTGMKIIHSDNTDKLDRAINEIRRRASSR